MKKESIIEKKKKKQDQIELLEKPKLNTIEVLISKSLIDSYISHDKFVSVNNVLRKTRKLSLIDYIKIMDTYCASYIKNKANKNSSVSKIK